MNSCYLMRKTSTLFLQLIKHVFCQLDVVVIVSSANAETRSMIKTSLGSDDSKLPLCVVFPSQPRFYDPSLDKTIPSALSNVLLNSRALFAKTALEYIESHSSSIETSTLVDFMDDITAYLARRFTNWKVFWPKWFSMGQLCLLLSSSFAEKGPSISSMVITPVYPTTSRLS